MIRFFHINDPLRIIGILLLLLIILVPLMILGMPLTQTELTWLAAGEKLNNQAVMYRDVWDSTGFLAALVYKYLNLLFGKSPAVLHITGLLLVVFQASYFNIILNKHNILRERTYVPALVYATFSCVFFDFTTLSPVLLGLCFLLPALATVFAQAKVLNRDERIFDTGIYLGIAALFHFPLSVFLLFALLSFVLYTGTRPRRYFLLISGFLFPFFLTGVYFFWFDGLVAFLKWFIWASLIPDPTYFVGYQSTLIIIAPLLLLTLLASFKLLAGATFINYQEKCQKLMYLWLIFGTISIFLSTHFAPYQFMVLLPAVTLLGAHYFLLIRKRWLREAAYFFFLGMILWLNYGTLTQHPGTTRLISLEGYTSDVKKAPTELTALVLSEDKATYYNYALATPFLNWKLNRKLFEQPDDFYAITTIYRHFEQDPPDTIIDPDGLMPAVFERLPLLEEMYVPTDTGYRKKH